MSVPLWADPMDGYCEQCGVNYVYGDGICSMCQADEDFYNCEFCKGTSCTGECDDEEGFAAPASPASAGTAQVGRGGGAEEEGT